jgi:hypothetical protein
LIGAGLPNVRYDPVPITFRTASKRRDGPEANILLVNYRTCILPRIQLFEEAPHQNSDNHDRQYDIYNGSSRSIATMIMATYHRLAGFAKVIKSFSATANLRRGQPDHSKRRAEVAQECNFEIAHNFETGHRKT